MFVMHLFHCRLLTPQRCGSGWSIPWRTNSL